MKFVISMALALFFMASVSSAEHGHEHKVLNPKDIKVFKTYPLKTCIVSDEAFGGDMGEPLSFAHDGQEYTICCKSCIKKFAKDPAKFAKKLADKKKAAHAHKADAHKDASTGDKDAKKDAKKDAHAGHDHGDHKH